MKLLKEKASQNKDNQSNTVLIGLDQTDRKLLQIIQDEFPIVQKPWHEISKLLKISENEVTKRLKRLIEAGAVMKIGPILDSPKIGLNAATLVAMKIPKKQVDDVARIINQYENISHNYEREDDFNVWFTLVASNNTELSNILSEIRQKIGVKEHEILDLPTVNRFKINLRFQLI